MYVYGEELNINFLKISAVNRQCLWSWYIQAIKLLVRTWDISFAIFFL